MKIEDAVNYYRDRLIALTHYSNILEDRSRVFFLTNDDLINNTRPTLDKLEAFLGLQHRLTEQYHKFDFTGIRGDPSPNIQVGRVLRDRPRHQLELDPAILANLLDVYCDCERNLRKTCQS